MKYEAIVIGVSAGGLYVLSEILEALPKDYSIPVVIVQHRSKDERELLEELLQQKCKIKIKQADEKEKLQKGTVYIAPPNYHVLAENDRTLSLSADPLVNYSRPSIDVLFETASEVYKNKLIGVILTGANKDGAYGMTLIRKRGGVTVAQNPKTAQFSAMPHAAVETGSIQHVLEVNEIIDFLLTIQKA